MKGRTWAWVTGAVAAVAVLGPALGPGSLLSLDLLALPQIPVPAGVWGLGPELPRRVPYGAPLAWLSNVIGGPAATKVFVFVAVAAAVAGAARLARDAPVPARVGAGLIYGLSPYLLTRIGAGHLGVVAAAAVLPWALPALLRPGRDVPRTLLWSAALGFTGVGGGTLGLVLVAVGLVADRGARAVRVVAAAVVGQLPWVVPGAVVAVVGVDLNSSARFATRVDGLVGIFGLPAGHGFWRRSSQVGGDASVGVALLGAVLVALAIVGMPRLPVTWGRRATAAAVVGAGLALASAVPGVRAVYDAVTSTPLFAPGRESQRWLVLLLVWLAPAAALGAVRMGGRLALVAPAVCALALAVPGLWGIDGRLEPVDLPSGWAAARARVADRPGPVLALPWHQYLDLRAADGRRVLNPLPDYLGGDVISSSDPELTSGRQEETDRREPHVTPLLDAIGDGRPVADRLAAVGVRWVVLLHEVDFAQYTSLRADPGLRTAHRDDDIELFEVREWRGPAVTAAARVVDVEPVVAPLVRAPASGPARWHRPAAPGWMRGWARAATSPVGTVELPAGSGPVWFWPTLLVLTAYFVTACALVRAGRACQLKDRSVPSDATAAKQTGWTGHQ